MLDRATAWGWVSRNPVALAKAPRRNGSRWTLRALSPAEIEWIRSAAPTKTDAALLSVLAYGGLRPGEALALTWDDVGPTHLSVTKSTAASGRTKTGLSRRVKRSRHLAADLGAWRAEQGPPPGDSLVFPGPREGPGPTAPGVNWRQRAFRQACEAAGLPPDTRPYDLRASCASLLVQSGLSVVEVASRMGHSAQVCPSNYASAFEEYEGPVDVDEEVEEARRALLDRGSPFARRPKVPRENLRTAAGGSA